MSIPRDFIELLLTRTDLVSLIKGEIPTLRQKSSANYFACCPFHQEKSPSFSVSQPKQFYYCFGCGAHGNAIDFIMQYHHLSFPEAVALLARQAGLEVPHSQATHAPKEDSLSTLFALTSQVSTYYYEQMKHSPKAVDYLKKRGISGQIAQRFQLGFAAPGWQHIVDHFGQAPAERQKLIDVGLVIKKPEGGYYDRFRDRIIFPIHDIRGRIIGFGGRVIDQGEPKYLNSPETVLFQKGHELYGLYQALKSNHHLDQLILVEGYMDVIALFQQGVTNAVATLGTATTPHHLQRLLRYTSDIVFCFDGDTAGRTAAWRALQITLPLMNDTLQVRFLFLPEGEDPDSLVRQEGATAFQQRMTQSLSLATFFFQTIGKQNDLGTIEGRARFANQALQYIKQVPPGIFQSILLEELSKRARIELSELKWQHRNHNADTRTPAPMVTSEQDSLSLTPPLRLATALLLQYPELIQTQSASMLESILSITAATDMGWQVLHHLIKLAQKNPSITTGILKEHWRSQPTEKLVLELASWNHLVPETHLPKAFHDALSQLLFAETDKQINTLLAKAAQEGLTDDDKRQLSQLIGQKKNSNRITGNPVTS